MSYLLSDTEKQMIDLAGTHYKYPAVREHHARERFGVTATQYWQLINMMINKKEALEYSPRIVLELRAKRERASRGHRARPIVNALVL